MINASIKVTKWDKTFKILHGIDHINHRYITLKKKTCLDLLVMEFKNFHHVSKQR